LLCQTRAGQLHNMKVASLLDDHRSVGGGLNQEQTLIRQAQIREEYKEYKEKGKDRHKGKQMRLMDSKGPKTKKGADVPRPLRSRGLASYQSTTKQGSKSRNI